MSLDAIILGGGLHGVHIGLRMHAEGLVPLDRLLIIDREPALCARWKRRTARTGMRTLRSPGVHHLGLDPLELRTFARRFCEDPDELFSPPYDRPALDLFDAHTQSWIDRSGLADRHVQAAVTHIEVRRDEVVVTTDGGARIAARDLILALGQEPRRERPDWLQHLEPAATPHLFEDAGPPQDRAGASCFVVGGGLSAVQVALHRAAAGHATTLFCGHALRESTFDTDPGWLGPKHMAGFERLADFGARRRAIAAARQAGTVSADVLRAWQRALIAGTVRRMAAPTEIRREADGLRVARDRRGDVAERIILATGLEGQRPGAGLIDALIAEAELRTAPCGFPIVDRRLRWHPRIIATGALAELELGPTARNIAGARRAADRIVAELSGRRATRTAVA